MTLIACLADVVALSFVKYKLLEPSETASVSIDPEAPRAIVVPLIVRDELASSLLLISPAARVTDLPDRSNVPFN